MALAKPSPSTCRRPPTTSFKFKSSPQVKSSLPCRCSQPFQTATVDLVHPATYYYIGKDPTWPLFCAFPFGLNPRQQNAWFYDGDGMKLMNEFAKKSNVYCLVAGNTGAQMGGWFRKEIKTV